MDRFEIAIEVGPIDAETIARLKAAGHAVYKGNRTWRVVAQGTPYGHTPVTAQAEFLAYDILRDFELDPLHQPPTIVLRDPDGQIDQAVDSLVLEDARRAYDPDPLPRPQRKWWQRQMELGLGERKGD